MYLHTQILFSDSLPSTNRLGPVKEAEKENEKPLESQSTYENVRRRSLFVPTPVENRQ